MLHLKPHNLSPTEMQMHRWQRPDSLSIRHINERHDVCLREKYGGGIALSVAASILSPPSRCRRRRSLCSLFVAVVTLGVVRGIRRWQAEALMLPGCELLKNPDCVLRLLRPAAVEKDRYQLVPATANIE